MEAFQLESGRYLTVTPTKEHSISYWISRGFSGLCKVEINQTANSAEFSLVQSVIYTWIQKS